MFRSYVNTAYIYSFFRYYVININIVQCIIIITVVSYWVLQNPFFYSLIVCNTVDTQVVSSQKRFVAEIRRN
jgi:hypothetical protein